MTAVWAGKLLLLVGCTGLGLAQGMTRKHRTVCLLEFRRALEELTRELTFSLPSVETLLEVLIRDSRGQVRDFFLAWANRFREGGEESWTESWQETLEREELPLRPEDRAILGEVGRVLGRYDGESQRAALSGILEQLKEGAASAREEERRLFRVDVVLGVTVGLFGVLLL